MPQKHVVTSTQFQKILPKICDRETTYDPDGWSKDNPLWAHCAVVSVLAQKIFGGEILFGKVRAKVGKQTITTTHYWNNLPRLGEFDFTAGQFSSLPKKLPPERRITRNLQHVRILNSKRYHLLYTRLLEVLNGKN